MTSNAENEIAKWESEGTPQDRVDMQQREQEFDHQSVDESRNEDNLWNDHDFPVEKRSRFGSIPRKLMTILGLVGGIAAIWFAARNTEKATPFTSMVETKAVKIWNVIKSDDDAAEVSGVAEEGTTPNKTAPTKTAPTKTTPVAKSSSTLMFSSVEPFVISISDNQVYRSFTGTLKATQTSDLGFNRTGTIERVNVAQGDSVKKGQLLAELDIRQLKAEISILEAQRRVEKARLSELTAGPRMQTIESARSVLKERQALRDQAKLTAERLNRLIRENAAAQQDVDNARKNLEAAENRVKSQQLILNELEAGTRTEKVDAQRALIERLDADVESVNVKIEESKLIAPFDGIVSTRNADSGAIVLPGAVVVRIVESKVPEAWIGLPSHLIADLSADRQYTLTADNQEWLAELKSIKPELDQMTRTQTVVFKLKEDPNTKAAGAFPAFGQIARLELPVSSPGDGMWIPRTSLIQSTEGTWAVFKIEPVEGTEEQWTVVREEVSVERIDSNRVLVTGEIASGDAIVGKGVHRLTPGQSVRPTE